MRYTFIIVLFIFVACNQNKNEPAAGTQTTTDSLKKLIEAIANNEGPRTPLTITALPVDGNPGQITFSRNDSTFFYYDLAKGEGKIILRGKEHTIDLMTFDGVKKSYHFAGWDLRIDAPNGVFKENAGEDCTYGSFQEITIRLGGSFLKLQDIKVQDCPKY